MKKFIIIFTLLIFYAKVKCEDILFDLLNQHYFYFEENTIDLYNLYPLLYDDYDFYNTLHKENLKFKKTKLKVKTKFRTYLYRKILNEQNISDKFNYPEYIYSKTDFSVSNVYFGYVFLHRGFEPQINLDNTKNLFLKKYWIKVNNFWFLDNIIIGHFKAGFGCGLVFYDNIFEKIKNIKSRQHGLSEDTSTAQNTYLRGVGFEKVFKNLNISLFYSWMDFDGSLREEKKVNEDILSLRDNLGEYFSESALNRNNKFSNNLFGFNISTNFNNFKFGLTGNSSYFDKIVDPDKTNVSGYYLDKKDSFCWSNVFRGKKLNVIGLYFEVPFDKYNIFGEVARSNSYSVPDSFIEGQGGYAVNLCFLYKVRGLSFYSIYSDLSERFYSQYSLPFRVYEYSLNGQQGYLFGWQLDIQKLELKFNYGYAFLPVCLNTGYITSQKPKFPSNYDKIYFELKYKVKKLGFLFAIFNDNSEKYLNLKNYDLSEIAIYKQINENKVRIKYEFQYEVSKKNIMKIGLCKNLTLYKDTLEKEYFGEEFFIKSLNKINFLNLNLTFSFFEVDKNIYLSNYERNWYDYFFPDVEDNSQGYKFSLDLSFRLFNVIDIWILYKSKFYFDEKLNNDFLKFQTNISF